MSRDRIPEELYFKILDMKYEEVSLAVDKTLNENPARFGNEPVWNWKNGMATRYFYDFHAILQDTGIKPGETIVDIGPGFGKMGIVIALMYPGVKFIGYEIVPERIAEFNRVVKNLGLGNDVVMIEQDLGANGFQLVLADYYYSWNPVNEETGRKLWIDLAAKAEIHAFSYMYKGLPGGRPEQNGFVEGRNPLYHSAEKARRLGLLR